MADSPPPLSAAELARYSRHILLENFGVEGQRKLAAGRVLIIGAGGLGSPAALYLAAAGVGRLGIADFDRVEAHNLHRQLLHDDTTVGTPKVESAARRLRATNPHIRIVTHPEGVTAANALTLFAGYDVIVDGTDNFSARYLNNDAAFFARRPLVYGSVFKFDGQVAVFDSASGGPCYRCLFPAPPPAGSVPGCGEAGVLGALCGVIGSLQALEAIKLLTGVGEPLRGRLLTYNALRQDFSTLNLPRDPHCPLCGKTPAIPALDPARYETGAADSGTLSGSVKLTCTPTPASPLSTRAASPVSRSSATPSTVSPSSLSAPMSDTAYPLEISVTEAKRLRDAHPASTVIIDVREPHELDISRVADAQPIPMGEIPQHVETLPKDKHLLILCRSGGRSMRVTQFLRAQGFAKVTNIAGGINAWADEVDPTLAKY